ncbi:MAG: hypothetical protein KC736_02420 [Candidatus Moranbacteria bacterium]|nr:hypothetical protein [Candidatus Moranbacteria bacterium]
MWHEDVRIVSQCDLLIAYVGFPSLGTGAELEIARMASSDIILWWYEGETVSRMALGNPAVKHAFSVCSQEHLLETLTPLLKQYV